VAAGMEEEVESGAAAAARTPVPSTPAPRGAAAAAAALHSSGTAPPSATADEVLPLSQLEQALQGSMAPAEPAADDATPMAVKRARASVGRSSRRSLGAARPTVDVWWVGDDGGLTMLVPWLLMQEKGGKFGDGSHRLRVFTVADMSDPEQTIRLTKREAQMVHLLKVYRGLCMRCCCCCCCLPAAA
jgi:hypothetical protein